MTNQNNAAHDLRTSSGGRAYLAEYFANQIGRHDFTRYINEIIAADFACALAQHLSKLRAEGVQAGDERALPPLPKPAIVWHSDLTNQTYLGYTADHMRDYGRAALASAPVAGLPERDTTKPAEDQGLFRKFDVRRTDGSDAPGGKHHGCRYFVLDVDHDRYAPAALGTYAALCEADHPDLARDLRERWGAPVAGEAVAEVNKLIKCEISFTPHGIKSKLPHGTKLYAAPQASEAEAAAFSTAVDYRRMEDTQVGAGDLLVKLAAALGNRDWKWWDSCSFRRLTFEDGPNRRDGSALHATVQPSDGHPDVSMAPGVREFIEAASPKTIAELLPRYTAVLAERQRRADELSYIARLRGALILARDSHGVSLLTDPPQDAWKARGVDDVIRAALSAQPEQS